MSVRQISVFVENRAGRIGEITETLAEAGVNIRGFSIADTADYGIVRLIVNNPAQAKDILKERGFTATETPVICVLVPDKIGALANLLKRVDRDINIEYMYSIVKTAIVMSVESPGEAESLLKENGISVLDQGDIEAL